MCLRVHLKLCFGTEHLEKIKMLMIEKVDSSTEMAYEPVQIGWYI